MSENVHAPLSASLYRTLTDKLYEKRKLAALEIEKLVRDLSAQQQFTQVERLLDVLVEMARSQNPHTRKGGLIGLAAAAIALGRLTSSYTSVLVKPVVDCLHDQDSRVRYYACEALYNIVKVARDSVMPHFGSLFDILSVLAADPDQNVRNGSELLDSLLKNIVQGSGSFQLSEFIGLFKERMYTKNANTRQFLIGWIQSLFNIPDLKILPFLPEILDGLFEILADPTQKIRDDEFIRQICQLPALAKLSEMVNVLLLHAQRETDDTVRYISLIWLREFLRLDGQSMLEFTSGYLVATLPCLSVQEELRRSIKEVARSLNQMLTKLITEDTQDIEKFLDLLPIMNTLRNHLDSEAVETRVAALRWVHRLYKRLPVQVFPHVEDLFPYLLRLVSDPSDAVVLLDLEVIADLCGGIEGTKISMDSLELKAESLIAFEGTSPYFVQFLISLLLMFERDPSLLGVRGQFIIRQLCVLLKSDAIFRALSVLLTYQTTDLRFVSSMVQMLNSILFTATELFPLRQKLWRMHDKESCDLFKSLYRCWCHQPIALISLCLLTQSYSHSVDLVRSFSSLDVTSEFLIEIDKLIQLIESPVFTYLRLELLDPALQKDLSTVLYGLLMLLPQTEAFHTLYRRLQCMPKLVGTQDMGTLQSPDQNGDIGEVSKEKCVKIDFAPMKEHFDQVQHQQTDHRIEQRRLGVQNLHNQILGEVNSTGSPLSLGCTTQGYQGLFAGDVKSPDVKNFNESKNS